MITFIKLNRWAYDPSRGLHENCKTPQLSDDELVRYLVKRANDDANLPPSVLGVVALRKRGPSQTNNATANPKAAVKNIFCYLLYRFLFIFCYLLFSL